MLPTVEIFGKTVGMYAVWSALGLVASALVATRLGKQLGLLFEDVLMLMLSVAAGLLVGGHLLYGITHIREIADSFGNIPHKGFVPVLQEWMTYFGGMVFYGGLIGGWIALQIYIKASHIKPKSALTDIFAVCVPLFHTFGRIGCFFGGCCYGKENSWGIYISHNHLVPELGGVVRFPSALIEAGCNLLIFLLLLYLYCNKKAIGRLFDVYLLIYSPVRFGLEFFRGDAIRGFWWGLSTSQWISLMLLFFVLVKYAWIVWKQKRVKDATS